jgi:hypothetical protein
MPLPFYGKVAFPVHLYTKNDFLATIIIQVLYSIVFLYSQIHRQDVIISCKSACVGAILVIARFKSL